MDSIGRCIRFYTSLAAVTALVLFGLAGPAGADVTPPDLTVCEGVDVCEAPQAVCKAGFSVTLTNFVDAASSTSGYAEYTYQVCSPPAGTCVSTVRPGESCLDNSFCQKKGTNEDPDAYCTRTCAVDDFFGLSHFDVPLDIGTCVTDTTDIQLSCTNGTAKIEDQDPSCDLDVKVAKCDGTNLATGACLTATVSIAGEDTKPGLGNALVVDKEGNNCTAACIQGPSCTPCEQPPGGTPCLTRTLGFWGTHPHIAMLYDPVTVCGYTIDGQAPDTCSTSEALCTSANDYHQNPVYLTLVAQLTAARLNLNATAALLEGACSTWTYDDKSIQEWLALCDTEPMCTSSKKVISESGCIEALNAFNNSQDTGVDSTPPPFDHPGPADPTQCQDARGNGKAIGHDLCLP